MDYSFYAIVSKYFALLPHFDKISEVLQKKFLQIENYDRQYSFGFSFGSRLCMNAGKEVAIQTGQTIDRMDLCDPAGKL